MVGGQFWSVYVPAGAMESGTAARVQLEQIDIAHRIIEAERVAERLQATRPASTATIAELGGLITVGGGAFVTRLGDDTLAVERFEFTPAGFEVTAAIHRGGPGRLPADPLGPDGSVCGGTDASGRWH